ncbi:aminoglycoside phosphotransferase family protein [Rhizobium deserti]|nr:aminoglycoside phosphotransferase family protein [Rhizobium deserti]
MDHDAPALPRDLVERWGITGSVLLADTRTSHVYRVQRQDAPPAIVKLLKPQGQHERPGMDFLAWRAGAGAVHLIDQEGDTCLLEDAGTTDLRTWRLEHGEAAANGVIAGVISLLQSASTASPPCGLLPLRRHFRALFQQAERQPVSELQQSLRWAAKTADELLNTQNAVRPLHGDLHHENIICGKARGWLAIDPQGLIGDPAYEAANIFGNPDGAFPDIIDPVRITSLAKLLAPAIGTSPEKIFGYAIAHAGLSLSWSLEDGRPLSEGSDGFERFAFLKLARKLTDEGTFSS